jgi:hypothetical protein
MSNQEHLNVSREQDARIGRQCDQYMKDRPPKPSGSGQNKTDQAVPEAKGTIAK